MRDGIYQRLIDPDQQAAAIRALKGRADADALLTEAAREAPLGATRKLIAALRKRGCVAGLHVLMLRQERPYELSYGKLAIDALAKMGPPGIAQLTAYLAEPPVPDDIAPGQAGFRALSARMYALEALSKLGPDIRPALPVLLSLRDVAHRNTRMHLPKAIAQACDDPDVLLDCLEQFAADPYQPVRAGALHYLGPCGHPGALPVLERSLGDADKNVRISAMHALASLGEAGKPGLLAALLDPEPRGRLCAVGHLKDLGGADVEARLAEVAQRDRSKKVRTAAQRAD